MTETNPGWLQFLQERKLPQAPLAANASFVAPLTHLGLVAASGDDAARFLHAQLTNDIEHLPATEARLAAYCSAKGRMMASLLAFRLADQILLELPRELLPAIQKRLQMFVLRSKVKLADASEALPVLGLVGADAAKALADWAGSLPEAVYGVVPAPGGAVIRLPDARAAVRYQLVTTLEQAQAAWTALTRQLQAGGPGDWRRTEIEAGLPTIVTATQEQFVPQMINFELVGGVNFRKGCYPGQEVVARSQYLGKLKRRMLPAEVQADAVAPGTEVFASSDPAQPSGMVVNAEPLGDGKSLALVELKTALLQEGATLHLGSAGGAQLHMLPSPYPITDPA